VQTFLEKFVVYVFMWSRNSLILGAPNGPSSETSESSPTLQTLFVYGLFQCKYSMVSSVFQIDFTLCTVSSNISYRFPIPFIHAIFRMGNLHCTFISEDTYICLHLINKQIERHKKF
jgi:hypothetical protein